MREKGVLSYVIGTTLAQPSVHAPFVLFQHIGKLVKQLLSRRLPYRHGRDDVSSASRRRQPRIRENSYPPILILARCSQPSIIVLSNNLDLPDHSLLSRPIITHRFLVWSEPLARPFPRTTAQIISTCLTVILGDVTIFSTSHTQYPHLREVNHF